MILVLNVKSKEALAWELIDDAKIIDSLSFVAKTGEDDSLANLDKITVRNKLQWSDVEGLLLYIRETSLTQVKVLTVLINTLAWQFDIPNIAFYNQDRDFSDQLSKVLPELEKVKKSQVLKVEYKHLPDISQSKKKANFSIIK